MVVVGTNVSLECLGVGTPTPSVLWRRVGGALPKDRQQVVVGALRIANVRAADNGQYVCEVSNGVHPPISHQIMLRVQGESLLYRASHVAMHAIAQRDTYNHMDLITPGHNGGVSWPLP